MASNKTKVIHLELDGQHYYFGSPKAMFDTIGEEKLGMKYNSFHSNISLKPGDVYTNRRRGYIVRVGWLGQAKTNRSNRWQEIINEGIANALNMQNAKQEQVVAEEPVVQAPAEPVVQAPAEPATEQTVEPVAHKPRKKKGDVPEQLTLF